MKYLELSFVISVGVTLALTQVHADPDQIVCKELKALRVPPPPAGCEDGKCLGETTWVAAKTTKAFYPENFDQQMNICSTVSYFPDCRGIHFSRTPSGDKDNIFIKTFAYNDKTKNIVFFEEVVRRVDVNYQIFMGGIVKMQYLNDKNEKTPVAPIPAVAQIDQSVMYAYVAIAQDGKWAIMQTCDKKKAWVAISALAPITHPVSTIWQTRKADIEAKLIELGINIDTMVDIPLTLPFEPVA